MSAASDFAGDARPAFWNLPARAPLALAGLGAAGLGAAALSGAMAVAQGPALPEVMMMAGPLGALAGAGGLWIGRRGARGRSGGPPPGPQGEAPPESLLEALHVMASAFVCWDA